MVRFRPGARRKARFFVEQAPAPAAQAHNPKPPAPRGAEPVWALFALPRKKAGVLRTLPQGGHLSAAPNAKVTSAAQAQLGLRFSLLRGQTLTATLGFRASGLQKPHQEGGYP